MKNNSDNNSNDQEQNDRPMVNQQNNDSEKQQILKKKQHFKTMNSTDSRLLSKGSKPEQKTVDQQLKSWKVSNSQLSKQNRLSKIQFQNSTVSRFTEIVPQCQCRWSKWINNNNYSPLLDDNRFVNVNLPCATPDRVECRVVGRPEINNLQPGLTCSTKTGLLCNAKKSSNFKLCLDYEIRVKCCRNCDKGSSSKTLFASNSKTTNSSLQSSFQTSTAISPTETYSIVDYQDPFAATPTLHSAQFLIIVGSVMLLVLVCIVAVFLKFRNSQASQNISKSNQNRKIKVNNVSEPASKTNSNNNNNLTNTRWNEQDLYDISRDRGDFKAQNMHIGLNGSQIDLNRQFICPQFNSSQFNNNHAQFNPQLNQFNLQSSTPQHFQTNVPQTKITVTRCVSIPNRCENIKSDNNRELTSSTQYESSMKSTSTPTMGTTSPARYLDDGLLISTKVEQCTIGPNGHVISSAPNGNTISMYNPEDDLEDIKSLTDQHSRSNSQRRSLFRAFSNSAQPEFPWIDN